MTNNESQTYYDQESLIDRKTERKKMGIKDRKEREKIARKKAILDAAREVFFEKGFHTTTMDQIAKVAELSKGSL